MNNYPNLTGQIELLDIIESRGLGVSSVLSCDRNNHPVSNPEKNQVV